MKATLKKFTIWSFIANSLFLLIQISLVTLLALYKIDLKLNNSDISQIIFGILVVIIILLFLSHYFLIKFPAQKVIKNQKLAPWQEDLGFNMITQDPTLENEFSGYLIYLKKKGYILIVTTSLNLAFTLITAVIFAVLK
ncbi:hypothetical protein [Spiroplasma chrysopicola]|uniref:DUF3899 domain-containing protein n=1 Tax=Spiroplasma chrysopicola DF-1 TaxID=1276227 RepID=R4UBT7_9MOLU|nr:hypothetical protein [Spiroplasma chrysopicola]AGM25384.1 hypothetical protein SCHRY_v1c08080 [Spiroplasma chrysopicola DF-1]